MALSEERRKECASCKEALVKEINLKLDKRGVRWFVGIAIVVIIAVWGGGYTMYAGSSAKQDQSIRRAEDKVLAIREVQIKVVTILGYLETQISELKKGQKDLQKNVETQTKAIIKAIRNNGFNE